jgi:hypothetical protein
VSVRSWTARIAGAANERSKWRLYSRRKRVLWATGLSIELMVIVAVLAWLFGRTVHDTVGVGAGASAAAI